MRLLVGFGSALAVVACACFPAFAGSKIEPGAKVYIEPMGGFETYLAAAFTKKKVPLTITINKDSADYIVTRNAESQKAGWAKMVFAHSAASHEEASVSVVGRKTGDVIYSYAVNKANSVHGKQSAAEACAKHLKNTIEK